MKKRTMSYFMWVGLYKIRLLVMGFVLLMVACSPSPTEQLRQEITTEIQPQTNHYALIVVSQSDCQQCVKQLEKTCKMFKTQNKKVHGIYYGDKSTIVRPIEAFMEKSKTIISWKKTSNIQLMNALYHASKQITGPYVVEINGSVLKFQ